MSRISGVLLLAVLLLAGCGADVPAPEQAGDTPPAGVATQSKGKPKAGKPARLTTYKLVSAVAAKVGQPPGAWVRYDRISRKTGAPKRDVFIEVLGAGEQEIKDEVVKAFAELGYKPNVVIPGDDGKGVRVRFTRVKPDPVWVLIRSKENGPALKNEKATASIYITSIPSEASKKKARDQAAGKKGGNK